MLVKSRRAWEIYLVFFAVLILKNTYDFFAFNSPVYFYFLILRCFAPAFLVIYFINLIQTVLNLLHLIPLSLTIYKIRFLPTKFWQYLFILRVIFDLFGHSYDKNILLSFYHDDFVIFWFSCTRIFFFYMPSYIACYFYAFKQEKLDMR